MRANSPCAETCAFDYGLVTGYHGVPFQSMFLNIPTQLFRLKAEVFELRLRRACRARLLVSLTLHDLLGFTTLGSSR